MVGLVLKIQGGAISFCCGSMIEIEEQGNGFVNCSLIIVPPLADLSVRLSFGFTATSTQHVLPSPFFSTKPDKNLTLNFHFIRVTQ